MMKLFFIGRRAALNPFNNYRLVALRPIIRALIVLVAVFNALLLIPDLINLKGAAATTVLILRAVYSLLVLSAFWWMVKLKSFQLYSDLITMMEAAALLVFLVVFCLYPQPDFTIQVLGMMVIILLIYLVPNKWLNMNVVAAAGVLSFLACELFIVKGIEAGQITAGMIYLLVVSVLCSIFSLHIRAYQYREYISRVDLLRDYATDPLTRLGNRVKLEEEAAKWMDWSLKFGVPLSLIVMDVDDMKQVNDTYGHVKGDAVLCQMAEELFANLRKNDVCVRWGGDEFMLLLPNTHMREAEKLARRVQQAISSRTFDPPVKLTCSFGIAPMQPDLSLSALIAKADESMYAAKKLGKNAVQTAPWQVSGTDMPV